MVTKRTERNKGRPRKPKEDKPKRARGRPHDPFANDPARYLKSFVQARASEPRRAASANSLAEEVLTKASLDAIRNGDPGIRQYGGDPKDGRWRDQTPIRAATDNLMRDLRRMRNAPSHNPDGQYLLAMDVLWKVCLQGAFGDLAVAIGAEALAKSIGEGDFFRAKMKPIMLKHAADRQDDPSGWSLAPGVLEWLLRSR